MAIFYRIASGVRNFLGGRQQQLAGMLIGASVVLLAFAGLRYTSSDSFCVSCHVHPGADSTWTLSTHYKNESGVIVHCYECHLPPPGLYHLSEKARMGLRDAFSTVFRDTDKIDWEERSALYNAHTYTYDSSCLSCHADLYSVGLTDKGVEAHKHYESQPDKLYCINCHKTVGHFHEAALIAESDSAPGQRPARRVETGSELAGYSETIPGTDVTFEMVAIPGGPFMMGSPDDEPLRDQDEGPVQEVALSPFWIGETEVTWNEFRAYFDETSQPARKDTLSDHVADTSYVDTRTGPTPKYGSPDIGGWESAYSMTHHAATEYCKWLSEKTGREYRLPTEAEWEYCARAGTQTPYFFAGDPAKMSARPLLNRIFGTEDGELARFVFFRRNSGGQVTNPYTNEPNPWGLYNMLGNVKEFCRDFYAADAYFRAYEGAPGLSSGPLVDPAGPPTGSEHVVRGGSYLSDPADFRSASRGRTAHDAWLLTDPHKPKSKWWYSDCMEVGFRVVREPDESEAVISAGGTE
ncbi:MAG: SUMF1/EgtB/PvdO family nonheme iron enzyme [Candidatus Glassbacteria bacterium]|nr:SUMF1/EgtB/PvdO family nonheme iron enzyme [Candidatus Glassbacteria bacterium]